MPSSALTQNERRVVLKVVGKKDPIAKVVSNAERVAKEHSWYEGAKTKVKSMLRRAWDGKAMTAIKDGIKRVWNSITSVCKKGLSKVKLSSIRS